MFGFKRIFCNFEAGFYGEVMNCRELTYGNKVLIISIIKIHERIF